MVYTVFFKGISFNVVNTQSLEVARSVLADTFFKNLRMAEASLISLDAIESDTEKTGLIMSCKLKYGDQTILGTVNAVPENQFFVTSWNTDFKYPQPFNINIL